MRDTVETTRCCVVGAGPAGVMLSLLLARRGVPVLLLESHRDFDRDFRGDTLHPSTLELLDQLGLADEALKLPHGKLETLEIVTNGVARKLIDFSRLKTRFPYVATLPQCSLLDFLVKQAQKFPSFTIRLGANVDKLVIEEDQVRGVRYRDNAGATHEVRADLTVATDGRFSRIRHLAGFEPIRTSPTVDIVWFRLSRRSEDPHNTGQFHTAGGCGAFLLERATQWQVAYVIPKGGYQELRAAGLESLQQQIRALVPWLGDRVEELTDWKQVSVLSIESNRLPQWYRAGLLLIGDAAHTMSPFGGVGINYAIQDAVEAANILADPLNSRTVTPAILSKVQKRREFPTRMIQAVQATIQNRIVTQAIKKDAPFKLPLFLRLMRRVPVLRDLPARLFAFGIRRVRIDLAE